MHEERSTYATTVRDSRYAREREFLKAVHKCVSDGGKVLVPTFALGRAQELCILLDDYWERMNLNVPIYFSAGLTIQANMYYKMLIGWTSEKVRQTYVTRNAFNFKHVRSFDRSLINAPGPCVLFATPGMLSGGFSLEVFKQWAPSEVNLITLPGYCMAGTIGHKLMSGKATKVNVDKDTQIDVRCQIHQLSFSPHTDAKGIMDLVKFLYPKHVILVHGEKPKMASLKEKIQSELGIQCYYPANNETVHIPSTQSLKMDATDTFIQKGMHPNLGCLRSDFKDHNNLGPSCNDTLTTMHIEEKRVSEGILVMDKTKRAKAVHQEELLPMFGVEQHMVQFSYCCPVHLVCLEHMKPHQSSAKVSDSSSSATGALSAPLPSADNGSFISNNCSWLQQLLVKLSNELDGENIEELSDHLQLRSVNLSVCLNSNCPYKIEESVRGKSVVFFCCRWSLIDKTLAWRVISILKEWNIQV